MEPIERSTREVREHLADVISDAIAGNITYITSNGRRVAAVVPLALAASASGKAAANDQHGCSTYLRGGGHEWQPDPEHRGEGLCCTRCGVTEAELEARATGNA